MSEAAETSQNFAMALPPASPLARAGYRLFPRRHVETPEGHGQDCIVVEVTSELSMLDRVRVLLSGRVRCEVRIVTENRVGNHWTAAEFMALPPTVLEYRRWPL